MTTKEKIIYESLKLFSTNGYEAVSTRDISRSLGMSDSAIYKHFKSKYEIFESIIATCKEKFLIQLKTVEIENIDWDSLEELCISMFKFQTHDEWITMFRRLLVLEQFKNEEMYKLYRKFFVDMEVENTARILKELQNQGYIKKELDPNVLAMEYYSPFFMYHLSKECDEEELINRFRLHVTYIRKFMKEEIL